MPRSGLGCVAAKRNAKRNECSNRSASPGGNHGGIIVVDLRMTRHLPVLPRRATAGAIVKILLASALTWCAGPLAAAAAALYRAPATLPGEGESDRATRVCPWLEDGALHGVGA